MPGVLKHRKAVIEATNLGRRDSLTLVNTASVIIDADACEKIETRTSFTVIKNGESISCRR